MFGIGTGEILLLLVIALIVLGPERMPKLARDLGRALAEFRKTSDELRTEFLNADKYLDATAGSPPSQQTDQKERQEQKAIAPTAAPEPPLTEAAVATDVPSEPDETLFDKEAREARERLRDPERAERARAEGWTTPSDEAGTSERWG
jgi:Tat protein translocase TatB subunit